MQDNPWGKFLAVRAEPIAWLASEGKSDRALARSRKKRAEKTDMTDLKIDKLDSMNQVEAKTFWTVLESVLANDDGAAAKAHLEAGRPICYCEDRYPDAMVRKWPDGRRELVRVDDQGAVTVIAPL